MWRGSLALVSSAFENNQLGRLARRSLALVSSAFQNNRLFPTPIKIDPQRTDNGVLRGHSPPRAFLALADASEAVWFSCPFPLLLNNFARLVNSPHGRLYDDPTCMLAAAARFVEDAFNVDAVVPFNLRASLRICQEALGKHVGFVLRRWPSFQLPVVPSTSCGKGRRSAGQPWPLATAQLSNFISKGS